MPTLEQQHAINMNSVLERPNEGQHIVPNLTFK